MWVMIQDLDNVSCIYQWKYCILWIHFIIYNTFSLILEIASFSFSWNHIISNAILIKKSFSRTNYYSYHRSWADGITSQSFIHLGQIIEGSGCDQIGYMLRQNLEKLRRKRMTMILNNQYSIFRFLSISLLCRFDISVIF